MIYTMSLILKMNLNETQDECSDHMCRAIKFMQEEYMVCHITQKFQPCQCPDFSINLDACAYKTNDWELTIRHQRAFLIQPMHSHFLNQLEHTAHMLQYDELCLPQNIEKKISYCVSSYQYLKIKSQFISKYCSLHSERYSNYLQEVHNHLLFVGTLYQILIHNLRLLTFYVKGNWNVFNNTRKTLLTFVNEGYREISIDFQKIQQYLSDNFQFQYHQYDTIRTMTKRLQKTCIRRMHQVIIQNILSGSTKGAIFAFLYKCNQSKKIATHQREHLQLLIKDKMIDDNDCLLNKLQQIHNHYSFLIKILETALKEFSHPKTIYIKIK